MARYDDWVYERGLENKDWVHDRWGDDDWDDDYDDWSNNNNSEGENEDMEQVNNRISFVKNYTDSEKLAIDTKIGRILKEFSDMEVGPCAFRLNDEVMCIYCHEDPRCSNPTMGFTFKYRDYDENKYEYKNGHYDTYSAKSLFITKYEREIAFELYEAKHEFEKDEKDTSLNIAYTREDGIETICKAKELGADIDLAPFLELPDLTKDEILTFIKYGYGYDYYLTFEGVIEYSGRQTYSMFDDKFELSVNREIRNQFGKDSSHYLDTEDLNMLNTWIKENPDKCILPENRHPELVEELQEDEIER